MMDSTLVSKLKCILKEHSGDIPRTEILNLVTDCIDDQKSLSMNCFWCGRTFSFKRPNNSVCSIECPICKESSRVYFGEIKAKRFATFKYNTTIGIISSGGKYTLRSFDISGDERQIDFLTTSSNSIELRSKDIFCIATHANKKASKSLTFRGNQYPPDGMIVITNFTVSKSHALRLFEANMDLASIFSPAKEMIVAK